MDFVPPSWEDREPEDREPGTTHRGWQHEASMRVEGEFREELFSRTWAQIQALIRSQAGPGAGAAFTVTPTNRETTCQVLPLSARSCRCGRPLDPSAHHRAACAEVGMLGRRGYALESIMARICRGVVDGLPVRGGAQVAIDTTMLCALHRDHDGVALQAARKRKERTYPRGRAQLVVALEVGGRWSEETGHHPSTPRIASDEETYRTSVAHAWSGMLACTAARAVASSLLDLQHCHGGDGTTPHAHEVDRDHRYAGLAPG